MFLDVAINGGITTGRIGANLPLRRRAIYNHELLAASCRGSSESIFLFELEFELENELDIELGFDAKIN